ncbi:hypothetical protein [Verrucosispora sp. WMMC514]|uniref:hypothetical protein n=1 Tax=Verrucosispora sp. WMMC514 TaxID=3015156 RepID=UPI00248B51BB|nr:hypothetical protein [Verrucosispora sp. WMMC514]WBB94132.1 hypothetical protein O7597_14885 [Verrucosispora sp. WMMC514]
MARYTHQPAIRALQDQLNTEHPNTLCYYDMCPHGTPLPSLPAGVIALAVPDLKSRPPREVVVLVSFKRREWGWGIVRADNGRLLGWTAKVSAGEHAGRWSAHVASGAFRGDGPDNDGDILDEVHHYLHNGVPNNSFVSNPIDYHERRADAAHTVVAHVVYKQAPAVGYPRHPQVRPYRTRAWQHFELDDRCVCGEPVDCPERARLLAEGKR